MPIYVGVGGLINGRGVSTWYTGITCSLEGSTLISIVEWMDRIRDVELGFRDLHDLNSRTISYITKSLRTPTGKA